jgi:hypothetical protein
MQNCGAKRRLIIYVPLNCKDSRDRDQMVDVWGRLGVPRSGGRRLPIVGGVSQKVRDRLTN